MKVTSLIVAGTPFSGATLLGHTLGAHSQAFFAGELWRRWDPASDPDASECRSCAGACAIWNDPAVAAAVVDGPAAVAAALATTTGLRLVIEGPAPAGWLAARLAYGASCGEDTRVVVCVCDPLLYVRKRAGVTEEYARRRVAEWCDQQNALVNAALASGRPLLVVRYEDLVERAEETLERICAFAGLEYEVELDEWWEAPTHAIGARSEAWGMAESSRTGKTAATSGDPRERRVETRPAQDRDPATSLGPDIARAVIAAMRPSGLYESFGYAPTLPAYRTPQDDGEREKMTAWVRGDLGRIRTAVMEGRAEEAVGTLRLLVDHFGPAFDELGLELDYEHLAGVLVDLFNQRQRGAEALPYAQALAEHAPQSLEAQRLLAVAGASAGDVPATLKAYERLVRMNGGTDTASEALAQDIAGLLVSAGQGEPAVPAFVQALVEHEELAAAVDATLAARLQGGDKAEGVYAAIDAVREARGLPLPPHAPPAYVLIALTNRCNYGCFFCCAENARADLSQRDLPIEKFYSLRSAIETAGVVDLSSPGEVFLYPHAREAMAFVAEHNRNNGFQITTNGALLTEDMIGPVASRIDQITVSLNAATPETYRRDLRSRHWERVLSNIRAARKLVARNRITLSCVTHAGNVHELPDLVRLAAELDVWHVRIVPIRVTKPELIRSSLWFDKEKAQSLIAEARHIGQEHGVIVNNLYEAVRNMSTSQGRACIIPTWGSYISMNGNVTACCHTGVVMGNVYETGSFEAIWNGARYRALRKKLYFPECRECPNIRGVDMDRLESHLDCQFGDRAPLPLVSVAVKTPVSVGQVRSAVSSLKRQTYPVWQATIEVDEDGDPAVLRAVQEEAQADPRIRCGSPGCGTDHQVTGAAATCRMDPAKQFKPNELEMQLRKLEGFGEVASQVKVAA